MEESSGDASINLIGIDDVVNPRGVFDAHSVSVFAAMARGARNSVSISVVGVLTAGAIAAATAVPITVAPSFTEPAPSVSPAEKEWATSVGRLEALLTGLVNGATPPHAGELSVLTKRAVTNAEAGVDMDEWAAALAAEVTGLG